MTLGWYCGSDSFGPYDHSHYDLTHCFQSLTIFIPPSVFMLLAFVFRMARIRSLPTSSLLIDPLPRFPQIISAFIALLSLFYLVFFVLQSELLMFRIIYPSLSFLAWTLSIVLLRFEHSRALPLSPYNRVFYLLSFIASAKQAESSVMNFVFDTPVMAFDILVFLHLFLAVFMLRYAITGVGDSSHMDLEWHEDLEQGLAEDGAEEEASPTRGDRSMWRRFLNFGEPDEATINAQQHSVNSPYKQGVRSSLDVRGEDRNPFAANPFDDDKADADVPTTSNPFVSEPTPSAPTSTAGKDASKVQALTSALREAHMLAGSSIALPSFQESLIGGRTIIQFQLRIALHQPSITSGDPDVDTVSAWKRYREFEGLHAALLNTARKYGLVPPDLPPAPKRRTMEEGRARLEEFLVEVMEQPLYWDDIVEFAGVKERVEYIAGYIQQIKAQKEQERRQKEEAVLAAVQVAEANKEAKKREREGRVQPGPATANGSSSLSVHKVTVERPAGLDYKYQVIAVSVSGWSRWMDDGSNQAASAKDDGGQQEEEKTRKKGSRSTLTTPVTSPTGNRRKGGGSANASLSSSAFYVTLDLPIKTSIGDYTVYHTLTEIVDFRVAFVRHFTATQPSVVSSIPALALGSTDATERDEEEMMATAGAVEVFFQSLISVPAFQCNLLYAFLERRKPKERGGEGRPPHLISGQKPLTTFSIAAGEWKAVNSAASSAASSTVSSTGPSPNASVPGSPALRGADETDGKRHRRGADSGNERKAKESAPVNVPLFPDVAPITPSNSSGLSPHSASPHDASALSSSLTSASPLGGTGHPSSAGDASSSHRFSASIPSFAPSNPDDPKSYIVYLIVVREYFSLTSFIEWQVRRRYRDFEQLHNTLQRTFSGYAFPPLPSKSRKLGKSKEGELEHRRAALEVYVQQIINVTMFQVDAFYSFFDLQNSNREFTVGTQVKAAEPVGELEGVREGGGGESEEEGGGGEGAIVGRSGGRRNGNGNARMERKERRGGEDGARKSRVERSRTQPSPQPTNPFDM